MSEHIQASANFRALGRKITGVCEVLQADIVEREAWTARIVEGLGDDARKRLEALRLAAVGDSTARAEARAAGVDEVARASSLSEEFVAKAAVDEIELICALREARSEAKRVELERAAEVKRAKEAEATAQAEAKAKAEAEALALAKAADEAAAKKTPEEEGVGTGAGILALLALATGVGAFYAGGGDVQSLFSSLQGAIPPVPSVPSVPMPVPTATLPMS